jgi:hypothetical protein
MWTTCVLTPQWGQLMTQLAWPISGCSSLSVDGCRAAMGVHATTSASWPHWSHFTMSMAVNQCTYHALLNRPAGQKKAQTFC